MSESPDVRVTTRLGAVRGLTGNGTCAFWNIPYAVPPVGGRRFEPPQPITGWAGVRDATRPGPALPQGKSRLAAVMGAAPSSQAEDALALNIFAPVSPGPHPVLFWLHGGGFTSGSAAWPWYDGRDLAARHQMVVVTASYRLGALGFLYLPELSDADTTANLGLQDQQAALAWAMDNVAAFGGDPERVTVGGQSAGALSARVLAASCPPHQLPRGIILQSPPASTLVQTPETARNRAQQLLSLLGVTGTDPLRQLRQLPPAAFVDATATLQSRLASLGNFDPFFAPVARGSWGLASRVGGQLDGSAVSVPMLIGSTTRESAAFLAQDPSSNRLSRAEVRHWFNEVLGFEVSTLLSRYEKTFPTASPFDLLVAATTHRSFTAEVLSLASSRRNARTWVYSFDWGPSQTYGACHCVDIPVLFRTWPTFADAPMLQGVRGDAKQISDVLQHVVSTFVHHGASEVPHGPAWPPYGDGAQAMRIDTRPGLHSLPLEGLEGAWL